MPGFQASIARLRRALAMTVAEAILKRIDDEPLVQEVQATLRAGEVGTGLQRIQEYGFTSVPLSEARAIAVFLGGNRDHGVVIATDDGRYRLKALAPGEVALYDDQGRKVHLTRTGIVVVAPDLVRVTAPEVEVAASTKAKVTAPEVVVVASSKVTLTTPLVEASGEVRAKGKMTAFDGLANEIDLGQLRDIYNVHVHPENDGGGPTDPPNSQA